ncbi:MAG: hypothetical protein HYT41_01460 [Candidatus Sungbacteria bacterium]|nr:hypothetical protein [Candidatus Sungbacteria bacterium]
MKVHIHLSPRIRLIMVSMFSAALIGGAGFAFWRMARSILAGGAVAQELHAKIDGFERNRIEAKDVEKVLTERAADYMSVREFYVDAKQPVTFLKDLEAIARATGTKLAIDLEGVGSDAQHLLLRLSLEGSEKQLLSYVRLLERMPYYLEITEVSYQNLAAEPGWRQGESSGRFVVSIRVRTR